MSGHVELDPMQDAGNNAPDHQLLFLADSDVGEPGILCHQQYTAASSPQTFDGELSVDRGDNYPAILGFEGTVHDHLVPIEDPGAGHAVSGDPQDECRIPMSDEVLVEVELPVLIPLRRRGPPGWSPA